MTEDVHKYLIFTLAGRRYAFELTQVAEVVEQPVTWPIPLAPLCYPGAMNFHGTIVAVMDLAIFFGLPGGHGAQKVIVLDTRIAALAFVVESIVRITPLNRAEITPTPCDDAFASADFNLPEGKITLLDASAIAVHAAETINT